MLKMTLSLHKGKLPKAVLVFFCAYVVFLVLWIQIKDPYCKGVIFTSSKLVAGLKGLKLEEITQEANSIVAIFSPMDRNAELLIETIETPVNISSFTFNAPLTAAIMAALSFFIKKKSRAYGEALLILIAVHLLYVFSLQAKALTEVLIDLGLEAMSTPRMAFYQFLWGFTDNMIIRFEPFLIGLYMFLRFRE